MTWMSCQMSSYKNIRLTYAGKCCRQGPRTIVQLMVAWYLIMIVCQKCRINAQCFCFDNINIWITNQSVTVIIKHFLLDLHLSHFHGLWREWKKLEKKGRKCIELLQNNAMHISRLLEFSQARLVRYHVSNILHRTKAFHTFRVGSIFIEGIETIAESLRGPACLFKLAERVLRIKFTYCNSFIQLSPLSFWLVALSFWRIFANKKIQQNVHRFFSFFSVSSAYRSEKI